MVQQLAPGWSHFAPEVKGGSNDAICQARGRRGVPRTGCCPAPDRSPRAESFGGHGAQQRDLRPTATQFFFAPPFAILRSTQNYQPAANNSLDPPAVGLHSISLVHPERKNSPGLPRATETENLVLDKHNGNVSSSSARSPRPSPPPCWLLGVRIWWIRGCFEQCLNGSAETSPGTRRSRGTSGTSCEDSEVLLSGSPASLPRASRLSQPRLNSTCSISASPPTGSTVTMCASG